MSPSPRLLFAMFATATSPCPNPGGGCNHSHLRAMMRPFLDGLVQQWDANGSSASVLYFMPLNLSFSLITFTMLPLSLFVSRVLQGWTCAGLKKGRTILLHGFGRKAVPASTPTAMGTYARDLLGRRP
ncbi:hypothetical protein PtA15_13A378 [Puccinia triticina]|uniref:Uncharacterized protein n=1 Tax=Puccinia triticina TaxID=208348 RepID=A0ABY7D1F8_9BASI|nr:uncharacterized protein PtA15_13A378 [Puccinia triticina]WAQ90978.1 hypothetical protein PtA15_13A378 [Puccinia triticina]